MGRRVRSDGGRHLQSQVACFRAACRSVLAVSASEGSNERRKKLSGPDLTQGVALSMVPDGTMLLGHARGKLVLSGAATSCSRLVPSARTTVLLSNRGSSSAIWFDA